MPQLLARPGLELRSLPGAGTPAPNRYSWSQVSPRSPPTTYAAKELKAFFSHSVRINREPQQHLSSYSAQPPGNLETANFISLQNAAAPCNSSQQCVHYSSLIPPVPALRSVWPSEAPCSQRDPPLHSLGLRWTGCSAQSSLSGALLRCAPVNVLYLPCVEYASILKGLTHRPQLKSLLS